MARFVSEELLRMGIAFEIDGSAAATGSETGNIIARAWRSADRPTVLLLAHMDTVQPEGVLIEPVLGDDGVVRSAGDTILGADNKAAVAALLTLLASDGADRANVVAVFSTCEEHGVMGASQLAALVDEVDLAFPIDGSHPVGTVLEGFAGTGAVQVAHPWSRVTRRSGARGGSSRAARRVRDRRRPAVGQGRDHPAQH